MKSIAGNANKFKHFPREFRWINDIWKTSGHRTQPARLKLKPDASNDWGLFDAELTLKTLHNTSWLNHPRWNRTKICLGQLLKSLKAKISELERAQIRNNRIHASSSITVLACFFSWSIQEHGVHWHITFVIQNQNVAIRNSLRKIQGKKFLSTLNFPPPPFF